MEKRQQGQGGVTPSKGLTDYEAEQRAREILRRGTLSTEARQVLELLAEVGVSAEAHLRGLARVSERTLRYYCNRDYFTECLSEPPALRALLQRERAVRPHALGKVGQWLVKLLYNRQPPATYEGGIDRISHDLLCALVCYTLHQSLTPLGYEVQVRGRHSATVYDAEGRPLVEPDALLLVRAPGGSPRLFLVEYHNEHWRSRAVEKVQRYEGIFADPMARWHEAWASVEPPVVLAVWTHEVVRAGYQSAIDERLDGLGMRTTFLGKSLACLVENDSPLIWHDFLNDEPIQLLDAR